MLERIVQRMAGLSPPCHRELVRGMVAELDAIADPPERARFAVGAMAAIARLALRAYGRACIHAYCRWLGLTEPGDGENHGGPTMSKLTTRRLLQRHATPFLVSFSSLTVLLLAQHVMRWVPRLSARGVPVGGIVEVVLLAVPFTLALTIPMAVFLAVSWVFTRLGTEGVLTAARRERHGTRRLLAPVLGAAAVLTLVTLVSNAEIVPRANARLAAALGGAPPQQSDRTMTVGELRDAAREARAANGTNAGARAAGYEVEIQKKFALAAACLVLALVGAATAIRFPRGGVGLVLGAGALVFTGYYLSSVTAESLADRQMLSPLVGMWASNVVLLAVAVLLVRRSDPGDAGGAGTLVTDA